MKCKKCGAENPDSNKFCGDCGSRLLIEIIIKKSFESDSKNGNNSGSREDIAQSKTISFDSDSNKSKIINNQKRKNQEYIKLVLPIFFLLIFSIIIMKPASYSIAKKDF